MIFLLPYLVSALLTGSLAFVSVLKSGIPLARKFSLLLWLQFAWTIFLILETVSPGLQEKILWDNVQFPVSVASGALLYLFGWAVTREGQKAPTIPALLLFLPALVSGILAFTDPQTHLIRSGIHLDTGIPFGELVYGYTLADYLLFAWTYGLAAIALYLLLSSYAKAQPRDRRRYRLVIGGFLLPILGALPGVFDLRILGRRDLAPLWFALGSLPIMVAIFRFRLFDIMPLARHVLVDSLGDPLVMYDSDGLILDCNRAFSLLVGKPARHIRGSLLPKVLSAWSEDESQILEEVLLCSEVGGKGEGRTVSSPGGSESFRVHVSSVPDEVGSARGELCRVAFFRDVTELAGVELRLQAWNTELEGRIVSRIKDLEQEVSRRRSAEEGLRRVSEKIVGSQHEILVTLSEVVENRSPETANHVLRVGEYSRILAQACGLSEEGVGLVADAAPLHDVGKIAVPDSILNKPGALSPEEMAVMQTHTTVGYRILGSSERSIIRAAAVIALEHHERWDGSGYPAGKAGQAISLSGRIVCICDVFDALSTSRPYKRPWELARILDFLRQESGRMFDPGLVEILLANIGRFQEVAARYPDIPPESRPRPPLAKGGGVQV